MVTQNQHKPVKTELSDLNESINEQKSSLNAIVPAIEGLKESNLTPAIRSAQQASLIETPSSGTNELLSLPINAPSSLQVLSMDPDKNIDIELITFYKLLKPSELLNEPDASEIIHTYLNDINTKLKSWGAQKSHKIKDSQEYKSLQRKIDGFRAYK